MDISILSHLIGLGTVKAGLKAVNHVIPDSTTSLVEGIDHIQSSPAYMKYRVDQAKDFWDDHKEDVNDFFDNVGDAVGNGLETAGDFLGDIIDGIFS